FDSTVDGINRRLAEGLELQHIAPLLPTASAAAPAGTGAGRYGRLPRQRTLGELAVDVKKMLSIAHVQIVGSTDQAIEQVAVACGSGGEFLEAAERQGCQCLLTGEARFHTCLEAEALGRAMILVGHFASERFGVEHLARVLGAQFAGIRVWPSRRERDPLVWL
ncbi:MAG TPA: Nif3-like dinuclear metal center hexameric protein, partial [Pirellulales bacterium]|nr:Nif3-like dinuclear metal center hexameric protein [Pirellulales bacterium]